jgi:hypothetical protein
MKVTPRVLGRLGAALTVFAQGEDLLLQFHGIPVGDVDGHDLSPRRLYPSACGGKGYATLECRLDIAGGSNKFTESLVIFALHLVVAAMI